MTSCMPQVHRTIARLILPAIGSAGSSLGVALVLCIMLTGPGCGQHAGREQLNHTTGADTTNAACSRIISMAPSITEILFALGLGERVVGVTTFCDYPPQAKAIAKVGGYIDPNYEAIVRCTPDLVILFPEHQSATRQLSDLGIRTLTVDHNSVCGILASLRAIGAVAGVGQRADSLAASLTDGMQAISAKTRGLLRPTVLVSIGRSMGTGTLKDLYICGQDHFYDTLITLAGGVNACTGTAMKYPMIPAEGILRLNPQVIIDIVPDLRENGWSAEAVRREWQALRNVDAVRNNRIHIFGEDFVATPGPRFVRILDLMAEAIHPELVAEARP
jgi:iron complex transport system substrate-binding protein